MTSSREPLPSEAVEAYNLFIHGHIGRRAFLTRIQALAIGGVAASAMIEALMPNYALAQQVSPEDYRIHSQTVTVASPQGNGHISGYFVRPTSADSEAATSAKLPAILVIHENRGLNPYIKDVARRLALQNFMVLAPDGLTSLGGFPGDDYHGGQLFNKVDRAKMFEDFVAAAEWLRNRPDCTGKLGAIGFCFGGSTVNQLAVRLGADLAAGVPFYGAPPPAQDIPKIRAAILVHQGALDHRLAPTWPGYDQALTAAHVPHEGYVYENSVHGFFCDATPERYNREASELAWTRTLAWFNKYLRS